MRSRAHDRLVGEVLAGRYRIVAMLGKGGMGAVYEAVQEDLGRRVAIKVLHPFLSEDAEHIQRFKREARAAASLGHPNVIQVTDFHSAPGELAFLVMEYLEGMSLKEIMMRDGAMAPGRVIPIILQVLSALGVAHGAGIIHRDLKPGNIVCIHVDGVGEIAKLLDFGIAKLTEGTGYTMLTRTGVTLGTPVYMAPEQVTGRFIDPRTDIYAVGIIFYRALAGRAPFKSADVGSLLQQILEDPAPRLKRFCQDVDERLAAVVEKAIAKNANERYQSTAEMAAALEPWASGPINVYATGAGTQPPKGQAAARRLKSVLDVDSTAETHLARPTPGSGVTLDDTDSDPLPAVDLGRVRDSETLEDIAAPWGAEQAARQEAAVEPPPAVRQEAAVGPTPTARQQMAVERPPAVRQEAAVGPTPAVRQQASVGRAPPVVQEAAVGPAPPVVQEPAVGPAPPVVQEGALGPAPAVRQQAAVGAALDGMQEVGGEMGVGVAPTPPGPPEIASGLPLPPPLSAAEAMPMEGPRPRRSRLLVGGLILLVLLGVAVGLTLCIALEAGTP